MTLEGDNTRPTPERVKEAVFSMIQFDLEDANFLDLFAGSGQMGLEALSRGAAKAHMIDRSPEAAAIIRQNAEKTHLSDRASVMTSDAAEYIRSTKGRCKFDFVFLDPPYRMENTGEICAALYDGGLLAEAFLLVVEHRRGCAPLLDARFEAFDQRSYGDTQITFARRAAAQEDNREDGTVPGEL